MGIEMFAATRPAQVAQVEVEAQPRYVLDRLDDDALTDGQFDEVPGELAGRGDDGGQGGFDPVARYEPGLPPRLVPRR
jgi:hypothetical protein